MDIFSKLADSAANRIATGFTGLLLRRLARELALEEAEQIASLEAKVASYSSSSPAAANVLRTRLAEFADDDPSLAVTLSIGRQILADSYDIDTPAMRGEPGPSPSNGLGDGHHHPGKSTNSRMNGSRRFCPDLV